ncbi:MAG: DUF3089 domain-containing protein [Pseudomonadota bacterium]|nr:DUF3089 domain-containing protein [Pseudomonadota bacterium]
MCARRFLLIILILTLLVVAAAFAIFQFGERVLIEQATPQGQFQAPPRSSGPDYASAESWIARPGITDDPSAFLPGDAPQASITRPAHAFFIHPTTYLQRDLWNAPLSGNADADFRSRLFVQSQASAFNGVAEVWAPRYRQAAFGAFLLDSEDARKALDVAYGDVERAFDHFLAAIPAGEPIILAGHSQGALHLSRLLVRHGGKLKDRLIAAYVVGWPVSTRSDLPATGLPPCTAADQTGCVLSWLSFGEPSNPDMLIDSWKGTPGPSGIERSREDMLCVNPLTGTQNGSAPPSVNPGTLVPTADLTSATLTPGQVGARCENGVLLIDGAIPPLGPYVLPGNNYHVYDYALFWGAVRKDAERRTAAWQR